MKVLQQQLESCTSKKCKKDKAGKLVCKNRVKKWLKKPEDHVKLHKYKCPTGYVLTEKHLEVSCDNTQGQNPPSPQLGESDYYSSIWDNLSADELGGDDTDMTGSADPDDAQEDDGDVPDDSAATTSAPTTGSPTTGVPSAQTSGNTGFVQTTSAPTTGVPSAQTSGDTAFPPVQGGDAAQLPAAGEAQPGVLPGSSLQIPQTNYGGDSSAAPANLKDIAAQQAAAFKSQVKSGKKAQKAINKAHKKAFHSIADQQAQMFLAQRETAKQNLATKTQMDVDYSMAEQAVKVAKDIIKVKGKNSKEGKKALLEVNTMLKTIDDKWSAKTTTTTTTTTTSAPQSTAAAVVETTTSTQPIVILPIETYPAVKPAHYKVRGLPKPINGGIQIVNIINQNAPQSQIGTK